MLYIYLTIIFIFGLVIGSFLNVVIFRLETEEKIMNDRSKCMNCKHVLLWKDLFPVLSFIFLKGRCRYCQKKISIQYPLVELITASFFVLIFSYFFVEVEKYFIANILFYFFIISAFIVISVYDLRHYVIPDKVIYPAIAIAIFYNFYIDTSLHFVIHSVFNGFEFFSQTEYFSQNLKLFFDFLFMNSVFINHFLAAVISFSFFLAIIIFTKGKGMGGGDAKLGFLMGLVLGWPLVFLAILLASVSGSVIGVVLIIGKKKKVKSMIPFGPFLVFGTVVSIFFGEEIVKWYFDLFL